MGRGKKTNHFLENPTVGRPIVARYNWILTPASIFVGFFLKEFHVKFDGILKDSLSLVKILEKTRFNKSCLLFTVDFESLNTNIPVEDATEMTKKKKPPCFKMLSPTHIL